LYIIVVFPTSIKKRELIFTNCFSVVTIMALDLGSASAALDLGSASAALDLGSESAALDIGSASAALDLGSASAALDLGSASAALDLGSASGGVSAALDIGRLPGLMTGVRVEYSAKDQWGNATRQVKYISMKGDTKAQVFIHAGATLVMSFQDNVMRKLSRKRRLKHGQTLFIEYYPNDGQEEYKNALSHSNESNYQSRKSTQIHESLDRCSRERQALFGDPNCDLEVMSKVSLEEYYLFQETKTLASRFNYTETSSERCFHLPVSTEPKELDGIPGNVLIQFVPNNTSYKRVAMTIESTTTALTGKVNKELQCDKQMQSSSTQTQKKATGLSMSTFTCFYTVDDKKSPGMSTFTEYGPASALDISLPNSNRLGCFLALSNNQVIVANEDNDRLYYWTDGGAAPITVPGGFNNIIAMYLYQSRLYVLDRGTLSSQCHVFFIAAMQDSSGRCIMDRQCKSATPMNWNQRGMMAGNAFPLHGPHLFSFYLTATHFPIDIVAKNGRILCLDKQANDLNHIMAFDLSGEHQKTITHIVNGHGDNVPLCGSSMAVYREGLFLLDQRVTTALDFIVLDATTLDFVGIQKFRGKSYTGHPQFVRSHPEWGLAVCMHKKGGNRIIFITEDSEEDDDSDAWMDADGIISSSSSSSSSSLLSLDREIIIIE
jgi:hypothetical protein